MKQVSRKFGFPAPLLALSALALAVSLLLGQAPAAQAVPNFERACITALIDHCNASNARYTARLACASTALTQCLNHETLPSSAQHKVQQKTQQKGGNLSTSSDHTGGRVPNHPPHRWPAKIR